MMFLNSNLEILIFDGGIQLWFVSIKKKKKGFQRKRLFIFFVS